MNKLLSIVIGAALVLQGCSSRKTIDGVTYDTFGLINQTDKRNPNIEYDVCWGNVVWATIFIESVIAPIYFFGFDMFEPVGKKPTIKGAIEQ